jgi:hyaluronoglucosaminidase
LKYVDGRSLFYAAQTIKQLVKRNDGGQILLNPCTISDYPDINFRGIVEGFYGQPWSFDDRIELLRYFGKNIKLNTYIYGPKDDPYHRYPLGENPILLMKQSKLLLY